MKSILIVLLSISMAATAYSQTVGSVSPANEPYHKIGGELPPLKIDTAKIRVMSNEDFVKEKPLVLVIFIPTCEHCIRMAKSISNHAALFSGAQVMFLTKNGMKPYFADFEEQTGLNRHPEFLLGIDKIYALDKLVNYKDLPQINIYDKHQKLLKTFNGDTPVDSLKHYLP